MTRINTNIASIRGLRSMSKASKSLDQAMTRLSTGLKINSGRDNPSGLIASESLGTQISAIQQSITNSNRANNVIGTADSALGEIGGLLTQVRGLVQEGLNQGAMSQEEIDANQLQIDNALSAINRIASNTTFAGDKLIDGSKSFVTTVSNADAAKMSDLRINEAVIGSSGQIALQATVTQAASKGALRYSGGDLTQATNLEIGGSKGSEVVFLGGSSTVANIRDAINNATDTTGVSARLLAGAALGAGTTAGTVDLSTYTAATTSTAGSATAGTATLNSTAALSDVSFTAVTAGTSQNVSIEFVDPGANGSALGVTTNVSGSNVTISVSLATDGGGAITSTAADIEALINGDAQASTYVTAAAEGAGSGVVDAIASTALSGAVDTGSLALTDLRPEGTAGNISIVYADPGSNNAALGVAVTSSGSDRTITVNLATDASGNITSSLNDIAAAIAGDATASTLVGTAVTGDGDAIASAVASTQLTSDNANNDVTFTAATAGGTQNISIAFVDPGANNSALGVTTTVSGNNITLSVSLATDASGNVTSTADDIAALIAGDADASTYVTATASGDGSGVVGAISATTLAGGTDAGTLNVSDIRSSGATGNVSIVYADPGANDSALGVSVATSGNNTTITVSLATDSTGAVTSTLDDIAAALGASEEASAFVSASVEGDGSSVAAAAASTTLSEANGTVLELESSEFGTDQFVNVNVLSGSFTTTLEDGTTEARRDTGTDIGVTINGQVATGRGLRATVRASNVDASLTLTEASNVVDESVNVTINGGGAVFQIGQEVSAAGQIGIGIEAINTARLGGTTGKLYELGSGGGKSLVDLTRGDANGADVVSIIEDAINSVSTLRGRLGAVQKNVIDTNVATLGVALENIAEARSQIVDTDFAEETANLTKSQVLSQASISVLAIANQNPQQVLQLLG